MITTWKKKLKKINTDLCLGGLKSTIDLDLNGNILSKIEWLFENKSNNKKRKWKERIPNRGTCGNSLRIEREKESYMRFVRMAILKIIGQ